MSAAGGRPPSVPARATADVLVVGAGLVGLASALAVADRGLRVLLVNDTRRGEASPAGAGMLAPSVEHAGPAAPAAADAFAVAARDRYPDYVVSLRERTGVDVPLNRLGILQLALDEGDGERLRARVGGHSRWMMAADVAALEPALSPAVVGALVHPDDGAVNNLVLMRALKHAVGGHARVTVVGDAVLSVSLGADGGVEAVTRDERRLGAAQLVLATGAWANLVEGLPRALPVEPVRGQMMSVASKAVHHVVYGGRGYVVPRHDGRTLLGSTMERVGFDAAFTEEGVADVRRIGASIAPALANAPMLNAWAGLRPVTPDGLPILGRDPERPSLIYACGHSRNGILLAPLTGDCVADLAAGEAPRMELAPFRVERFG